MESEYRWLRITCGDPQAAGHALGIQQGIWWHVLQVRTREGPRGESWWGEWQDVPVISAESEK